MAAISETLTFQPLHICRDMLIIRYGGNRDISGKKRLKINRNNAEGCNCNFCVILFLKCKKLEVMMRL